MAKASKAKAAPKAAEKSVPFDAYLAVAEEDEREQLEAVTRADEKPDYMTLVKLAQEQLHCADEEERLSSEARQFRERKDEIRINLIPELMKKLGMTNSAGKGSFTFPGGKVNLEVSLKASVTVANKPNLFAWLRKNGQGSLIKEDVSVTSLQSLVKDRREDGLADPPGVSIFEQVKAKITRAK